MGINPCHDIHLHKRSENFITAAMQYLLQAEFSGRVGLNEKEEVFVGLQDRQRYLLDVGLLSIVT